MILLCIPFVQGRRQDIFQGVSKEYILDFRGGSETKFSRIYMVKIGKLPSQGGQSTPPADAPGFVTTPDLFAIILARSIAGT